MRETDPNFIERASRAWDELFPPAIDPLKDAVHKTQELVAKTPGAKELDQALGHLNLADSGKNLEDYSKYVARKIEEGTYGGRGNWLSALRNSKASGHVERAFQDLIKYKEGVARRNKLLGAAAIGALIGIPAYSIMSDRPKDKYDDLMEMLKSKNNLGKVGAYALSVLLEK
ncbi:MAG: hypothetical protein WC517_03115 [Patescibacteria group bacterium]